MKNNAAMLALSSASSPSSFDLALFTKYIIREKNKAVKYNTDISIIITIIKKVNI